MSYYAQQKRAFMDLQRLIHERKKIPVYMLEGVMLRRYGFGKKATERLLDFLAQEGSITVNDGMIKYQGTEVKKEEAKEDDSSNGQADNGKAEDN